MVCEGGRRQRECTCSVFFQEAFLVESDSNDGHSKLSLGALHTHPSKRERFQLITTLYKELSRKHMKLLVEWTSQGSNEVTGT